MSPSASQVKQEVEKLAAIAYFQHLISGYGDGEHPDAYQIVIQGKPKHYPLEDAYRVLVQLLASGFPSDRPEETSPVDAPAAAPATAPVPGTFQALRRLMLH